MADYITPTGVVSAEPEISCGCCALPMRFGYRAPRVRLRERALPMKLRSKPLPMRMCLPQQVREYVTDGGVVVTDLNDPVFTIFGG